MRQLEKAVCLKVLDTLWVEHLENMNHLRDSVRLRAYGQQDPLIEYKSEGHKMFRQLLQTIDLTIANAVFKASLVSKKAEAPAANSATPAPDYATRPRNIKRKVGRNDPCPCGSNKKYKKCCYPKFG